MDDSDKNKLKDVLSTLDPVEFKWDETNMSTGVVAQEIGAVMTDGTINIGGSYDTISIGSINSIDLGNITLSASSTYNGPWSISSSPSINIASDSGKNYIKTEKHKIDLDELAEMMETLKKRLLILAPNFEMHEKYPMLKELYDEYKAMEKLLSGPDSDIE
jgi:hypothetical protein